MAAGCPFITCAIKKKEIEFCWDCEEGEVCQRWRRHREFSRNGDTFVSYQKLEYNILSIREKGLSDFIEEQESRDLLLREFLELFNEGRSKSYYCIAATVLEIDELKEALTETRKAATGLEIKEKSLALHSALDEIAERNNYCLRLRKG
jgi:hypothetical protein